MKVLLALADFENGSNNGAIYFSDRKGAEITGLARNTVCRAIRELIEKGFIYCSERGAFSRKTPHAASYGLTWQAGPEGSPWRAPSHAYEQWNFPHSGNSRSQELTESGSFSEAGMETSGVTGADSSPAETEKRLISTMKSVSRIATHTTSQFPSDKDELAKHWKEAGNRSAAFQIVLREQLVDLLQTSPIGEQTRIALRIGCPGGTLSKFIGGRKLPEDYIEALTTLIKRRGRRFTSL